MKTRFYRAVVTTSAIVALSAGLCSAATLRVGVDVPMPDPNSPKSPLMHVRPHVDVPMPDPNSPKSPLAF
jgi:hypothetical protein